MQMLYPLRVPIQQYIQRIEEDGEAERCCPGECPHCETKKEMKPHGFYCRTIVDEGFDGVIRILRYLCRACRRTVSLLPEWALPYMRCSIPWIARVVTARLDAGMPWKAAAPGDPYQRGQPWVRRFRNQAEGLSAALAALTAPEARPDFVSRALGMLEKTGWAEAHRFLFGAVRVHLLGWPSSLAPCGRRVSINSAKGGAAVFLQTSCSDPKKASG